MASANNPDFSHITTVIFDMDGTLIEHTWQLSKICNVLFEQFANQLSPVTQDEFFDCYWVKSTDLWYMMVDGVIDGETAARYGYANTLRTLGQDPSLAQAMLDAWRALVLEEAVPFSDTFSVLAAVGKKYATGILTNGFTVLQRLKINKYQLADYVDVTLVSEEAGYHKPDPRVFDEMLKRMGQPRPEETLYIGDNLTTDISGALAAGITPIFMNPKNDANPPDGVLKITQLSQLLEILRLSGGA
ncbi:MAG: HAD family hydrolase [Chloroflexi bacterium]|nr:MAG: HAD family hydrolase [Chloroflexota bacterium]